jgi:hypothetical protein
MAIRKLEQEKQGQCLAFLGISSRSMPNAQDDDPVAFDAIAQDVGPDGRHLALAVSGVTATMGEFGEAVGQFDKPFTEPRGGGRIERFNIGDDRLELTDGLVGPDDLQFSRRRAGAAAASRFPRIAASAAPPNG